MPKKKLQTKSHKSKLIDELDKKSELVVGQEVIVDEKPIEKVKTVKKQVPEELKKYQWKPGQTGNPHGRPRDTLKTIGLRIAELKAHKILSDKEKQFIEDLGLKTADLKMIEYIMASLAMSGHPMKLEMFLDRVYGKVPNININAEVSAALVAKFKSKLTDAELERISSGEDALEILMEKIPDVNEQDDMDDDYVDEEEE
jgi:hypothetical protein